MNYFPIDFERLRRKQAKRNRTDYEKRHTELFGESRAPTLWDAATQPASIEFALRASWADRFGSEDGLDEYFEKNDGWNDNALLTKGIADVVSSTDLDRALQQHRWEKCGRVVYDIDSELAGMFGSMPPLYNLSEIHLSHPQVFFHFKSDYLHDSGSGILPYVGSYVFGYEFPESLHEAGFLNVPVDVVFRDGVKSVVIPYPDENLAPPTYVFDIISMYANDEYEAPLQHRLVQRGESTAVKAINELAEKALCKEEGEETRRQVQTIFNAMMYINSIEPDIEIRESPDRRQISGKKKGKGKKVRFHSLRRTRVYYMGHNLIKEAGKSSPVGHMRRGHTRWQRCGKGLKNVKLIFIKPMWVRGRDDDSVHVTKVGPDESEYMEVECQKPVDT